MNFCCQNLWTRVITAHGSGRILQHVQSVHPNCKVRLFSTCENAVIRRGDCRLLTCSRSSIIASGRTCNIPTYARYRYVNHVNRAPCCHYFFRLYSDDAKAKNKVKPQQGSSKHKLDKGMPEVKPPGAMRTYIMKPLMLCIEWMEKGLGRFPRAYKLYMRVKVGMQDIFADAKLYFNIVYALREGKPITAFKRLELECYRQVVPDMIRIAPILILSAPPLMNYVVIPLAYFFPRHLLCRHFWSPEQRLEFGLHYLSRRIHHQRHILHYLDKHSSDIPGLETRKLFQQMIQKVKNGSHPTVEEIVQVRHVFDYQPFGIDYLARRHKIHSWHLAKSMNLWTGRERLTQGALLLHHIDLAMAKEGIQNLTTEELQQSCFVRGLNATGLSREEMINYLQLWASLSKQVDGEASSITLMLHGPVLLAYNRETNKMLHSKKTSGA